MSERSSPIERHRGAITRLALSHRARSIAIFGSVAKGDDDDDSDIDFLVVERGRAAFDNDPIRAGQPNACSR